jgi:hypothetical protein
MSTNEKIRATRGVIEQLGRVGRACLGSIALAGILCFMALGCSGHGSTPVYPVRGQVLLNGKPLADAIVSFHAQLGAALDLFPSAHTDADGRFALTSHKNGDGAPPGTYSISVVCFRSRPLRKGQDGRASNVVPQRYADPPSSGLSATVQPGDNELPAIKLKSP